jgi:hypothetical protein
LRGFYSEIAPHHKYTAVDELNYRTAKDCADYLSEHMVRSLQFDRKEKLWDHAVANISVDGIVAEFGVFGGYSINYLSKKLKPKQIFGFDSFEGLPVDWAGAGLPKGTFHLNGSLPKVESNVTLIKGWFNETVMKFMSTANGPFALVHIDGDVYESARDVFNNIQDFLVPGTIIIFDEYFGFRGWRFGEHLAWKETVERKNVKYNYLAFTPEGQTSVLINNIG